MSEKRALSGAEIVERVTAAIYGCFSSSDPLAAGRAAIQAFLDAIEEPSDAMQIAAVDAHGAAMMARIAPAANMLVSARMWASTANSGDLIPVWRAMIAALRKEIAG